MIAAFVIAFIIALFFVVRRQYSHWDHVGIKSIKPKIPFGNIESVTKNQRSFGTAIYDLYKQTTEPFIGIYLFFRPALLVRDKELVKSILTTDFQYFHDRGVYCEPESDPMSANLFSMNGESWKNLRSSLTPVFTSGKLKGMFSQINEMGGELVKLLKPMADKGELIEIRDLAGRYVIDCLASIAFGQEGISTIDNPDHDFCTIAIKLNDNTNFLEVIRGASSFICPTLLKVLRMKSLPQYVRDFSLNLVTNTIEEREKNNIVKKDLMQYLIQLRNKSDNSAKDDEWKINAGKVKNMTYEQIAAQVFLFYVAGNETTTSTVAYTLYELTQNEELMKRAKEDVINTLEQHDGQVTYESIMNMKFIDLCVKETLRKYPGLPILNRICTKDYDVPGSSFKIKKGTSIIISLLGIHRDEKFFPNPEKYDPDRFTEENHAYDEDMYMPFGIGPRICIAFRMGLLVAKTAIVMLLKNYNFEANCKKELEFDFGTVGLLPIPGQCKIKITPNKTIDE